MNVLALLLAQQAYHQAVITRIQAQASRLMDTAALFQSLGGGWNNPPHESDSAQGDPAAATPPGVTPVVAKTPG